VIELPSLDCISVPPIAPAEPVIDREHLSRMTLGEQELEREVLSLFDRQASMLMDRMKQSTPAGAAAAAHTLKGSARGIGAFAVARAAEAVEAAALAPPAQLALAVGTLSVSIEQAHAAIADILNTD
jgi:HPt (histidine-containing phosphotransfer) domain-containing protein